MLAPMEGVTNYTVRTAIAAHGHLGVVCTEFVRISHMAVRRKEVEKVVQKTAGLPLSVQIMGNDASKMADSAASFAMAGADIVDINLGCPTAQALKGNVGAAMLKDPDLLFNVLSAMRQQVPGWMSAKIRAGFEEEKSTVIGEAVEAAGVDFIIVHPRRRKDQYQGIADWRIIGKLTEGLKIPVVGNGDIWYPQDATSMLKQSGCHAIMIGRGALRNPWIFRNDRRRFPTAEKRYPGLLL